MDTFRPTHFFIILILHFRIIANASKQSNYLKKYVKYIKMLLS